MTEQTAGRPKRNYSRLIIIGVAILVAIFIVQAVAKKSPADDPEPAAPAIAAPAGIGVAVPFTVDSYDGPDAGGTATINKTVRSFRTNLTRPKSPDGLLVLDVTVTATAGQVSVNPLWWKLRDAQGYTYDPELGEIGPQLESGDLPTGATARGVVAFDVPTGTYTVELEVLTGTTARFVVTG